MIRGRGTQARRLSAAAALLALAACAGAPQRALMREAAPPAPETDLRIAEKGLAGDAPREAPSAEAADRLEAGETLPPRTLATQPAPRPKPPALLARIEGPDLEALPFVVHDVSVVVAGHRARVVFDMVFANPSKRTLAGTLMIGLPDRASPCYLATFDGAGAAAPLERLPLGPQPGVEALLGQPVAAASRWGDVDWGKQRPARVVEPVRGRQVYEAVTRRRVDPALAEWAGSGTFSARVYPIAPSGAKRVVFAYDQTLTPSGGKVSLALPEPAAEAGERRVTVHEIGGFYGRASLSAGGAALAAEQAAGSRTWRPSLEPKRPAELLFEATLRAPALSVLAGADAAVPGTLATLLVAPELPPRSLVSSTGRALFLLDTSYSGKDALYALSGQMLRRILETDDSIGEFAILAFDVRAELLTPGFVPNTREVREGALADVERVRLEGATSFATVVDAVKAQPDLQRAATFFLLSDGEITWGPDDPRDLLAAAGAELAAKRWICYQFGAAPHNERLFAELTRANGQIVRVGPAQDLDQAARAHRSPVSHLEWVRSPSQDEVVVAGDPGLLYPGEVLEIAVRTARPAAETRLVMRIDGRDTEVKVPLARTALTDALAARAWAETFAGNLPGGDDEAAQRVIFALSRHFFLANDFASFLILETDEEYRQYGVTDKPLDFREIRQTLAARRAPAPVDRQVIDGLALPAEMPSQTVQLIRSLATLPPTPVWASPPGPEASASPRVVLQPPRIAREADTPAAVYRAAEELFGGAGGPATVAGKRAAAEAERKPAPALETAQALRGLSTIAELAPRDDRALRLVGFALLDWGFYDEAGRLFGRVRARRPFEPQNLLLEAIAESARGELAAAALRHEVILSGTFPRFGEQAQAVSARLYADLLRAALRAAPQHPLRAAWERRLAALVEAEPALGSPPAGRLVLFWNLDDTDVDLHVREGLFSEVWYERMESRSGGRLFWDNTEGLGPELYEHPRLSRRGFDVFVDYFGSSSVEGEAPAATFVAAFTRSRDGVTTRADFHATVLMSAGEDRVRIMPVWKRR